MEITYVSERPKKTNLLNYRFSKQGDYLGARKNFTDFLDDQDFTNIETFRFQPICLFKDKTILEQLNCWKPLGPCDVPALTLKDCLNIIAQQLTFLIDAFLAAGNFPSQLKRARIIPIYKNGDTEDPSNHRPISKTSALSKMFETAIEKDQIDDFLKKNHLHVMPFEFRRGFSKTDVLLCATEKVKLSLDNEKLVASALLDLSKALTQYQITYY